MKNFKKNFSLQNSKNRTKLSKYVIKKKVVGKLFIVKAKIDNAKLSDRDR